MELYRLQYLEHHGIDKQRWGRRRFQNEDGTLTELGKQRLKARREAERNKDPVKYASMDDTSRQRFDQNLENAYNDRGVQDKLVREWDREDTEKKIKVVNAGQKMIEAAQKAERDTRPEPPPKKRMNLSDMTDQELRERIQREQLERQYNEVFNQQPPARISKGRQFVQNALTVSGAVLATASTALGIALAIKQLRDG
jgi:imidazolonepropionase-like amidohydrolase